jgi:hypothetical protein
MRHDLFLNFCFDLRYIEILIFDVKRIKELVSVTLADLAEQKQTQKFRLIIVISECDENVKLLLGQKTDFWGNIDF